MRGHIIAIVSSLISGAAFAQPTAPFSFSEERGWQLAELFWPDRCVEYGRRIPVHASRAELPDTNFLSYAYSPADVKYVKKSMSSGDGSQLNPWGSIQEAMDHLSPGQIAYVYPDTYPENVETKISGLPTKPIRLAALDPANRPIITAAVNNAPVMKIQHSYWIVDGFELKGPSAPTTDSALVVTKTVGVNTEYVALLNIHAHDGGGGAGVNFGYVKHAVLRNSTIHDFRKTLPTLDDSHGVLVGPGSDHILIEGNESWGNSGDSVQCQGTNDLLANPPKDIQPDDPKNVTIFNNHYRSDDENAVDIKSCQSVTVRDNNFHSYVPSARSTLGTVIVVHYNADNVLIEGNEIWDSNWGASVGSIQFGQVRSITFRRNRVHDLRPGGSVTTLGFRIGPAEAAIVYNNTFHGLSPPDASTSAVRIGNDSNEYVRLAAVFNNIVHEAGAAFKYHLGYIGKLATGSNLIGATSGQQPLIINYNFTPLASWQAWQPPPIGSNKNFDCGTTLTSDPQFVPGTSYRLQPGSPAQGNAIWPEDLDFAVCVPGPDIGAVETCP
jgi:hypothetical protein